MKASDASAEWLSSASAAPDFTFLVSANIDIFFTHTMRILQIAHFLNRQEAAFA